MQKYAKYNPKVELKETNDEVPNLGFSLSNQNLKTGFKFLYALNESIKEMILHRQTKFDKGIRVRKGWS